MKDMGKGIFPAADQQRLIIIIMVKRRCGSVKARRYKPLKRSVELFGKAYHAFKTCRDPLTKSWLCNVTQSLHFSKVPLLLLAPPWTLRGSNLKQDGKRISSWNANAGHMRLIFSRIKQRWWYKQNICNQRLIWCNKHILSCGEYKTAWNKMETGQVLVFPKLLTLVVFCGWYWIAKEKWSTGRNITNAWYDIISLCLRVENKKKKSLE